MKYLKLILNFIPQHKYLITLLIFGLIIGVLDDENSLITRAKHAREISELKAEIKQYRQQYEMVMKKENEDIYIFEEDLNKKK